MKKEYGIFWLSQQRELYSDDSYYVLGELFGVEKTEEEALKRVEKIISETHLITILPIYRKQL